MQNLYKQPRICYTIPRNPTGLFLCTGECAAPPQERIAMQVTHIRLRNFRSYEALTFEPQSGLCALVGENAAGKTNVLEAMFLCALGRSHRTRHDSELIMHTEPEARVEIGLTKSNGTHSIACRLRREQKRELRIDDMPLSRSGELLGCLHVVMFSPEDLRIIKQGPAERRRFLDMELSQLYPAYYYALQQYNTVLKHRNALLKDPGADERLHAPFEEQLARIGADIMKRRAAFMEQLKTIASELHRELSGGKETLRVVYQPSLLEEYGSGEDALFSALQAGRARDILRGSTSVGPHRDDMLLELDGVDVRAYGSQGQQRTAALSLKLSELLLLRELEKDPPVLLLDDVLSELDSARQRCLVSAMRGCQTFLTCTELAGLRDAGVQDMAVYEVANGSIRLRGEGGG